MIPGELIEMSNRYGSDPEMVLAGGGNTSAKDKDTLYVKASGTKLASVRADGFVAMDRGKLEQILEKTYPQADEKREAAFLADVLGARKPGEEKKRPSVEALLHHIFPQTYVLHVHPALVNGLTCGELGEQIAGELFGEEMIWIPALKPGYMLAVSCREKMKAYYAQKKKNPSLLFLQNHGVFFAADSTEEISRLVEDVVSRLKCRIQRMPESLQAEAVKEELERLTGKYVLYEGTAETMNFVESEEKCAPLLKPFSPDHIVYYGAYPLFVGKGQKVCEKYEQLSADGKAEPKLVLAEGMGAFLLGEDEEDARTAAKLFGDARKIAIYAESFGGPLHMTPELTEFIVNWEAESYRKKQK